jgi:CRP/FNR family transcriptional regulator, cyclic AMP receptor protein
MTRGGSLADELAGALPPGLARRLADRARQSNLRPRQIVIGYQDRSTDVFVVLEGKLRVELHSPDGKEIILADIGPGQLFGELSAIDGEPRTASVSAVTQCRLAVIPGAAFREEALGDPASAEWLARRLVRQVRRLDERVYELNTLAVRNRLHCELLRLSIDAGITDNRAVIEPAPTHAELAARIGTHREAVTRELQYLAGRNIVVKQDRALTIDDVSALTEIVRAAAGDVDLVQRSEAAGPQ